MAWSSARGLLNTSVVKHLGESLALTEASGGPGEATVRGVLTRPEEIVRLGLSHVIAGDARLALRTADAPAWLKRGVGVATELGEAFEVTAVADNGEGILEVTLCRSS